VLLLSELGVNGTDILVSDNGFGELTYKQLQQKGLKYTNLENLEDLKDERYRYLHYCAPFEERFFYWLRQCIDIADRVQAVIIHEPVEYDNLIKFQRRTQMPIIYMPHGTPDTVQAGGPLVWYWSMIGEFSDALIVPFKRILEEAGIREEHKVLVGL
jgi:hypothetical protein